MPMTYMMRIGSKGCELRISKDLVFDEVKQLDKGKAKHGS